MYTYGFIVLKSGVLVLLYLVYFNRRAFYEYSNGLPVSADQTTIFTSSNSSKKLLTKTTVGILFIKYIFLNMTKILITIP